MVIEAGRGIWYAHYCSQTLLSRVPGEPMRIKAIGQHYFRTNFLDLAGTAADHLSNSKTSDYTIVVVK